MGRGRILLDAKRLKDEGVTTWSKLKAKYLTKEEV